MRRRSVLRKQSVRKKKRKGLFSVLGRLQRLGSAVLVLCLVAAGVGVISGSFLWMYNYLLTSPYLRLEQVEMGGIPPALQRDLIQLGGLSNGTSLLAIRLDDVKEKMEEHAWVRSVRVERRFPNKVVIDAELQTPSALVVADGIYYLNRWGEIFKKVQESEVVDFPIITGISLQSGKAQEQLYRVSHVLQVLELEEGRWSADELSEIHIRENGSVSLYFEHLSAEVRLMWYDLENKLEGLKKVTEHLTRSGKIHQVSRIDLNQVDGAVVSFGDDSKRVARS
jgi:cell division protein FtsQ